MTATPIKYRKCHSSAGDVEAYIERHWYASRGFYRVEVSGFGLTESDADRALQAMLVETSAGVSLELGAVLQRHGREVEA